ncbi:MAG: hypothetical protein AB7F65_03010 [Dehalococcoidia bacterium]
MVSPPDPASADDELPPLPSGWRAAFQTAPLWIPASGGVVLGLLGIAFALVGVGLAVVLALGAEDAPGWVPDGLRSGWVVVVAAVLALALTALRRTDLVWLSLRILRRDIPTAIVASAAVLGVATVAIAGGDAGDAASTGDSVAAAVTATATPAATEATSTPTPTSTPLPVTASTPTATPTPTPALPAREPAERPFALEQLTFDDVCAGAGSIDYQCGVLSLGGGIARLIEAYVAESPSAEARSCNLRAYDALVQETLARNGLALEDTIQGEDVFALPPLPCDEDGNASTPPDRGDLDTAPADAFLDALAALLAGFPATWSDPAPSELSAIAAAEAHATLLDILDHFRDRYDGTPAELTATSDAYALDGDYYLLRVTVAARVDAGDGCSAHRHRWFALVEVDPSGRLVAVGDARFTSPFSASELCAG